MTEVKFYDNMVDELLKFAMIITKAKNKYVFCKHKEFKGERTENNVDNEYESLLSDVVKVSANEITKKKKYRTSGK